MLQVYLFPLHTMPETITYRPRESKESVHTAPPEVKRLEIDMRVPSDESVEKSGAYASPELLALNERQQQEKQEVYNRYEKERVAIISETHEAKQDLITDKARHSLYDTL